MVDSSDALRNVSDAAICGLRSDQGPEPLGNMPSSTLCRIAVVILAGAHALAPSSAFGQEQKQAEEDAQIEDPLTGDATFGLTITEGNSETLSLNFAGRIAYEIRQHTWSLSTTLLRTRDGGEIRANRGDLSARYKYEPGDRFFLNSQFRASYNRPAGIERRLAPGLGIGYDVLRGELTRLSLDAGMNWIGERFTDDTRESSLYFNLEQKFTLRVNETTDLEQRLAYSPRPDDLGDYLIHASLALTTQVWKFLGIKTQISDDFDSTPFVDPATGEARSRNDLTFITGLNVSF